MFELILIVTRQIWLYDHMIILLMTYLSALCRFILYIFMYEYILTNY